MICCDSVTVVIVGLKDCVKVQGDHHNVVLSSLGYDTVFFGGGGDSVSISVLT